MKRSSGSAVGAGAEMPAEPAILPASRVVEEQLSRPFAPSGPPSEQSPHVETVLAHLARRAALGEMLAGIVQEINQPLFAIQNYARALVADPTQSRPSIGTSSSCRPARSAWKRIARVPSSVSVPEIPNEQ
jgi:signal transduction histidine kinase